MKQKNSTPQFEGKMKKAVELLAELTELEPDIPRTELIQQVEVMLDLSPRECEFFDSHFK